MSTLSTLWALLTSLPEIIRLVRAIELALKEAEVDRKVKDDVKAIHEAFTTKDAKKLNDIFNPSAPSGT